MGLVCECGWPEAQKYQIPLELAMGGGCELPRWILGLVLVLCKNNILPSL